MELPPLQGNRLGSRWQVMLAAAACSVSEHVWNRSGAGYEWDVSALVCSGRRLRTAPTGHDDGSLARTGREETAWARPVRNTNKRAK